MNPSKSFTKIDLHILTLKIMPIGFDLSGGRYSHPYLLLPRTHNPTRFGRLLRLQEPVTKNFYKLDAIWPWVKETKDLLQFEHRQAQKFSGKEQLLFLGLMEAKELSANYAAVAIFGECILIFLALNPCDDKICSAFSSEK